jgi:hypothetical protein
MSSKKKPAYIVYNVTKREGREGFWKTIGGAFTFDSEKAGKGISIPSLNLVLLEPVELPGAVEDNG